MYRHFICLSILNVALTQSIYSFVLGLHACVKDKRPYDGHECDNHIQESEAIGSAIQPVRDASKTLGSSFAALERVDGAKTFERGPGILFHEFS